MSKAFEAYYLDGEKAYFNTCENRMRILYERLHGECVMYPWMWDWKRYGGKNKDMVGFFYEDDMSNIEQIDAYKAEYERKHRSQKQ